MLTKFMDCDIFIIVNKEKEMEGFIMIIVLAINKETKEEKVLGVCDPIAQAQEDIDTITEWDDLDNVSDWDLVIRKEVI